MKQTMDQRIADMKRQEELSYSIPLLVDSYKMSQYYQYPPDTEYIYSYFESRGGEFPETVFFGLQYLLFKRLAGTVVTQEKIDYAERRINSHFGYDIFNRKGWEYILKAHNGMLPVSIRAVPEGSVVPSHNVLFTIENTDPECFWLTSYLETLMVMSGWFGTTVATLSYSIKKILLEYAEKTGCPLPAVDYKFHDFGFRGVSSVESAAIGAASHMINFRGSDTFAGNELLHIYYGAEMPSNSIAAMEHSTVTSWNDEVAAYKNMLEHNKEHMCAMVSDSYDYYRTINEIYPNDLKEEILAHPRVVIQRPDSGVPKIVVADTHEMDAVNFGFTINEKGYKDICRSLGIIQGDGINKYSTVEILDALVAKGFSITAFSLGCGSGLLQQVNRDTCKFAMKCSAIKRSGKWEDVFKKPSLDPGKNSKRGRLMLVKHVDTGEYATLPEGSTYVDINGNQAPYRDELVEVFRNGEILCEYTFDEVRKNAWGG